MTKFDKDTKDKIIYAISKGATYQLACDYAGISYQTFKSWMRLAKSQQDNLEVQQSDHVTFLTDVKKAQGSLALHCLEKIEKAAEDGQWTAAAWKLERIHSKYYSKDAVIHEFREELEKLKEAQGGNNETKTNTNKEAEE